MADTYGLLTHPVPVPAAGELVSDPALRVLLDFAKAVLNTQLGAAWAKVAPGTLPATGTFGYDPEPVGKPFNDKSCPALYAYRKGGHAPYDLAIDYAVTEDTIVLLWVYVSTAQDTQALRAPAVNGAAKVLDRAVRRGRTPEYVKPGDADPQAATLPVLPIAVKLAVATSTSPVTYSGAALDGATGGAVISPRRPIVVSLGGDARAFVPGSHIVITGTNGLGLVVVATLVIPTLPGAGAGMGPAGSGPAGDEGSAALVTLTTTCDFATVTSVAVDAQSSTTGTLSVGLGAYAGLGSLLTDALGLLYDLTPLKAATARPVVIRMVEGPPLTYPGVEWQFTLTEQLQLDPSEYDALGSGPGAGFGLDLSIAREDGSIVEDALL